MTPQQIAALARLKAFNYGDRNSIARDVWVVIGPGGAQYSEGHTRRRGDGFGDYPTARRPARG